MARLAPRLRIFPATALLAAALTLAACAGNRAPRTADDPRPDASDEGATTSTRRSRFDPRRYMSAVPWLRNDRSHSASTAEQEAKYERIVADLEDEYAEEIEKGQIADPLYYWNLMWFQFNDRLYFWGLKPLAQGYDYVMWDPAQRGIRNFVDNLGFPVRCVNCALQGKFEGSGTEIGRFAVNTTVGVLGFWDAAEDLFELEPQKEDTGQTLGVWGLPMGFYLVWPVLGPSSLRGTAGRVGDYFLDPLTYYEPFPHAKPVVGGVDIVNDTSLGLNPYESIRNSALDPYLSVRDAYVQNRRAAVER